VRPTDTSREEGTLNMLGAYFRSAEGVQRSVMMSGRSTKCY
jgi:hypothetical protein